MREIKFKFWNNKLKKMSKVHGLGIIYEHLSEEWDGFDWEDVEKLQYTGLKDKSGVEIYEGDILKLTHEYDLTEDRFHLHDFIDDTCYLRMFDQEGIEIIGNIHELLPE